MQRGETSLERVCQPGRDGFQKCAILLAKGCGLIAVDIDFADHPPLPFDGNNNFGARFQAAGEVARIRIDVVNDYSITAGRCRARPLPARKMGSDPFFEQVRSAARSPGKNGSDPIFTAP